MTPALAYLDSSAFMKLVVDEPESVALTRELAAWPRLAASELLVVEVTRAARRQPRQIEALRLTSEFLRRIGLRPLTRSVLRRARGLDPAPVETLDALHLGTAVEFGAQLGAFFTYDGRLGAAARAAGLPVLAPGT